MLNSDLQDKLEIEFVDQNSLHSTIESLAEICRLKHEHISTNWQDYSMVNEWNNIANVLDRCAEAIRVRSLRLQGFLI